MLRWSFYDKKQTEKIVRDFGDLNSRIMDHIKLVCLGSAIGVDLQHLNHLKTDDNSKKLGFDVDATLKLTVGETQDHAQSLEIMNPKWIEQLHHTQHVDGEFAVLNCIGARVLEESRTYVPFPQTPHGLDPRTKDRVDALARLLQQPKEQVFRIPRCIGWKFVSSHNRIAFLFEVPPDVKPQPVSLIKLLENLDMKMSLGGKFRLAHSLAKCMAQLHMVRWVGMQSATSVIVLILEGSRVISQRKCPLLPFSRYDQNLYLFAPLCRHKLRRALGTRIRIQSSRYGFLGRFRGHECKSRRLPTPRAARATTEDVQ